MATITRDRRTPVQQRERILVLTRLGAATSRNRFRSRTNEPRQQQLV